MCVDQENPVYIHDGVLFSHTNNEIMSGSGKWRELETIVLEI
jgi:hypothetical protein